MESNHDAMEKVATPRERLASDLKTLTHDAEDLLKATAGDVSERAREARARLGVALERARATCATLQKKTVAAAKKTDEAIHEHPYPAMGIAFGIGMLTGWLVTRRMRKGM